MSVLSVQALRGFPEFVSGLGGDLAKLLARARIRAELLDDPRNFVPITSVIRLLEDAARELACPDLGLRMAGIQDLGVLGPLAVAVQNSATLGDALRCASRYMFTHSPAVAFSARQAEREGRILLVHEVALERELPAVQDTELSVALAARIITLLSEGRHHLRSVRFPHRRCSAPPVYRRHFGAPVRFECDAAALEVDVADLSLPIPAGHPVLRDLAEHYLETQFGDQRTPVAARVRAVLLRSLGTGRSSNADVARALALHPRSLQRWLQADGTSFERIKDEVRAELARRYLEQQELPLSRVAFLLDYSEQSVLTRSCYRWFGRSPRAMRAELTGRQWRGRLSTGKEAR